MIGFITFLTIVIFILSVVSIIGMFIQWAVHISMSKDECQNYGYANYRKFKKVFESKEISKERDKSHRNPRSFFTENMCYHASIIKFDGKCMIINNPFSYLLVVIYMEKYIYNNYTKKNRVKWWYKRRYKLCKSIH